MNITKIVGIISIASIMMTHGIRFKNTSFELSGKESYDAAWWSVSGPSFNRQRSSKIAINGEWVCTYDVSVIGSDRSVSRLWQDGGGFKKDKKIKMSIWVNVTGGESRKKLSLVEIELRMEGLLAGQTLPMASKKFNIRQLSYNKWIRLDVAGRTVSRAVRFSVIITAPAQNTPRIGRYLFDGASYEYDGKKVVSYKIPGPRTITEKEVEIELKGKRFEVKMEEILFKFDSYELSSKVSNQLNGLSRILGNQYLSNDVWVNGYADDIGDSLYNKKLSLNRATAVANYLKYEKKINNNLQILGYGELQSIVPDISELSRQKNRRAEVIVKIQETTHKKSEVNSKNKSKNIIKWVKRSELIQNLNYSALPDDELLLADFDSDSIVKKNVNVNHNKGENDMAYISYQSNKNNGRFIRFSYSLNPKLNRLYASVKLSFPTPIDARKYTHLRFKIRTSDSPVRVKLLTFDAEPDDHRGFFLPSTYNKWKEQTILLRDLEQEYLVDRKPFDLSLIRAIQFQAAANNNDISVGNVIPGWIEIDDIYFINPNIR